MANDRITELENAKNITPPTPLYNGSFILEFLEPPDSLHAT